MGNQSNVPMLQFPKYIGMENKSIHKNRENFAVSYVEVYTRGLYVLGFALLILNRIFDQIADNISLPFLSSSVFVMLALCLLAIRFIAISLVCNIGRGLLAFLIVALSALSYIESGQTYLISASLLILGIGKLDIRNTIKCCSIMIFVIIAALAVLATFQYLTDGSIPGSVVREDGRLRLSLYFAHPNTLAAFLTMSYFAYSVSEKKLSGTAVLYGFILLALEFVVTDSRTSSAILALYLFARVVLEHRDRTVRLPLKIVMVSMPIVLAVLCLALTLGYTSGNAFSVFQSVLNGRPGFWQLQYDILGSFTMFGQMAVSGSVYYKGWNYTGVTIDCFYAEALLSLGAWSLVAFIVLYIRKEVQGFALGDWGACLAIACCALLGLTEIHMADFAIATPLVLLGEGLYFRIPNLRTSTFDKMQNRRNSQKISHKSSHVSCVLSPDGAADKEIAEW